MSDMNDDYDADTNNENVILDDENSEVTSSTAVDKAGKFTELAKTRVDNVAARIEQLGRLSNRSSYEYSPEQIAKIFEFLEKKLADAKEKFEPKKKESEGFSF